MQYERTIVSAQSAGQDRYVLNHTGYVLGAPFVNGVLGQLSWYEAVDTDTLQFVRIISTEEHDQLSQQPIMTWYMLVHSQNESIALLRFRFDPLHSGVRSAALATPGQVGV